MIDYVGVVSWAIVKCYQYVEWKFVINYHFHVKNNSLSHTHAALPITFNVVLKQTTNKMNNCDGIFLSVRVHYLANLSFKFDHDQILCIESAQFAEFFATLSLFLSRQDVLNKIDPIERPLN